MNHSYNSTACNPDGGPASDRIPGVDPVINYCWVPALNASHPRIVECCRGSAIGVADNCYAWCPVPARFLESTPAHDGSKKGITGAFGFCLKDVSRRHNLTISTWACNLPRVKESSAVALSGYDAGLSFGVLLLVLWNLVF